jgi:hypothetical protein
MLMPAEFKITNNLAFSSMEISRLRISKSKIFLYIFSFRGIFDRRFNCEPVMFSTRRNAFPGPKIREFQGKGRSDLLPPLLDLVHPSLVAVEIVDGQSGSHKRLGSAKRRRHGAWRRRVRTLAYNLLSLGVPVVFGFFNWGMRRRNRECRRRQHGQ